MSHNRFMASNKRLYPKDEASQQKPNKIYSNRIFSKEELFCGWECNDSVDGFSLLVDEIGIDTWIKDRKLHWMARGITGCQLLSTTRSYCDTSENKSEGGLADVMSTCYSHVHSKGESMSVPTQNKNRHPKEKHVLDVRKPIKKVTKSSESSIFTMNRFQEKLEAKRELKVARLRDNFSKKFEKPTPHDSRKKQLLPHQIAFNYKTFGKTRNHSGIRKEKTDSKMHFARNKVDENSYEPSLITLIEKHKDNKRNRSAVSLCEPNTIVKPSSNHQTTSPVHFSITELLRECRSLRTRRKIGSGKERLCPSLSRRENQIDSLQKNEATLKYKTEEKNGKVSEECVKIITRMQKTALENSNFKASKHKNILNSKHTFVIFPPLVEHSSLGTSTMSSRIQDQTKTSQNWLCHSTYTTSGIEKQSIPHGDSSNVKNDLPFSLSSVVVENYNMQDKSSGEKKEVLPPFKTTRFECPLKRARDMADKRLKLHSTSCRVLEGKAKKGPKRMSTNDLLSDNWEHAQELFPGDMVVVNRIGNKTACLERRCPSVMDSGLGE